VTIDGDHIISTIEDPDRIKACAAAAEADKATLCTSDIIVAPLLSFSEGPSVKSHVAVVKVLKPIQVITDQGTFPSIQPGEYIMDYWFDSAGVFYAAMVSGYLEANTTGTTFDVVNQQAPAVPALFVNADGSDLTGAQISACRIFRRCGFFQRECD
jgi:hypothetical protein